MSEVERRLSEQGLALPEASAPAGVYVPYVLVGDLLHLSGQIPMGLDPMPKGALSADDHVDADPPHERTRVGEAQRAARQCALNLIAQAKAATGDLDRVVRVVKLVGFVASAPDFGQQPIVVNAASRLMAEAFGEAGVHARSAVGVAALPFGVMVEIEAILQVRGS
ncbi:MAG: RidA family protein [Paracoccaceae bacterium]